MALEGDSEFTISLNLDKDDNDDDDDNDDITLRTILLKCLTTAEIQLQASTEVRKRHCTDDVKRYGQRRRIHEEHNTKERRNINNISGLNIKS
jgi:hypothetical protein